MRKTLFSLILIAPILANSAISIQSSYNKALDYEAKVQSYGHQKRAVKEDITQAKSRLYPKISVTTSATYRDYKLNSSGKKRDEQYYTLKLSGDLPIYHPEYYNKIKQARLKYNYSDLYLKQLKQELAYNVTDAFMLIVKAKNSLTVAKAYLEIDMARYNQIKTMYDKKLSNKMDLLSSKVTYERSKIKVNTEKQNLRLAKFKFTNLTSIEDIDIPKINLQSIDVEKLFILTSEDELDNKNLEIQKSNLNINLTKKQVENSKYGYYPKVDLSASFSKYDANNIYTDYENESRIMINLKMPIYQGGYVNSQVAKYRYLLSAANEDLKGVQRKIISSFKELSINLKIAKENIVASKEAIESSTLYMHAITKGYEHGLRNLIDLEDAKVKLLESHFKLIDSVYNYVKAYTSLLNLFGDLNEEKLQELDNVLFER